MDLYFKRHDGHAVTCDDFRAAMADANGVNLDTLGTWYSQVSRRGRGESGGRGRGNGVGGRAWRVCFVCLVAAVGGIGTAWAPGTAR